MLGIIINKESRERLISLYMEKHFLKNDHFLSFANKREILEILDLLEEHPEFIEFQMGRIK